MGSIKVLFVDDDEGFLDQAKTFLERIDDGLDVDTVTGPVEALQKLDSGDYDIVVSDYQMPRMDGLEFLEEVRDERDDDIPFIMFTGKGREEVAMKALNLGADRYMQKRGDPRSQYGVLAQAINQESTHYKVEKSLDKRNKLLRNIFEGAKEGFYIRDKTGKIKFVNQSFADIHGYEKRELIGMNSRDLLSDDCRERVKDIDLTSFPEDLDMKIETKDGDVRHIQNLVVPLRDNKGKLKEFLGISHDITEVKEKERELKKKERLFQSIFEDPDIFIGILECDGTLVSANKASLEFLGAEESELEGKKFWNTPWWDHSEELQERLKEAISRCREGEYQDYQVTHVGKGGEKISIDFSLRPVKNDNDDVVSLLAEGKRRVEKEEMIDDSS